MAKLRDVPHTPGVYVMRDRLNSVIYVGKARDLRKRLSNYFTPARSKLVDRKTRALIASIWDFDVHEVRNEPESLLLEGKLIKEFRPKYNISFRDDKRFLMVRVNLQDEFPKFTLTRMKRDDGARYFGPFAHSGALRTTLNWLNKKFGLRVCKPIRPDELTYKHCSNDIIKNCSAPCIGRVTTEEYRQRMEQACSFLDGKGTKDLVALLEEEMQKAAMKLDFEKAAELRDMVEDLRKTLSPTRSFQRGSRIRVMSTLDPMADVKELQEALGLGKPPLVMECFDIANIGTAHCVASMVRFKDGVPDNSNYRRYRIRAVTGQNDFISMAEVIRRRFSRILLEGREVMGAEAADFSQETPLEMMRRLERVVELEGDAVVETEAEGDAGAVIEMPRAAEEAATTKGKKTKFIRLPDLVIVDGGKGQLGMAMKELQRLGLADLPIIGLAKEREEIYRPHEPDPLVLPHETGALKLLQRIRDEAHRWANGYHQLLLGKRVEESLLDDCPGVSQARKATLLKKFGSVARLRKATAAEVATVPGISATLAETIMDFLKSREG